jgi:alkanesulfonate monooxygenase SsuD/methylene tetrahydromethanopterin reductase-like flavin-dependent oxidoreductase (luciferase family)
VRIGVQLPEVERGVVWEEVVAIGRAAEEVGFDSVWVGDHLLYRDPDRGPWEAWTQLAALAAVTERVTLGPLVACLAFHPPLVLAKMALTVQAISGGRLVLGVGAGWNDDEFVAAGLPTARKVSRFETAFGELREHLASAPMPAEVPPIPLMSGSSGPRALSIVLPHVASANVWWDGYGNTAQGFAAWAERLGGAAVERSACVLVTVAGGAGERVTDVPAVPHDQLPAHLDALAAVGVDEAILILDPITEASVRAVAPGN